MKAGDASHAFAKCRTRFLDGVEDIFKTDGLHHQYSFEARDGQA